jgi:hypothetical protein
MGATGYSFAKTQTWDKKVIEAEKIYQEILGGHGS